MIHLNRNILCAVSIDVTGDTVGIHDMLEVAVLPLNYTIDPHPELVPFNTIMKPERFVNSSDINLGRREKIAHCIMQGLSPLAAGDLFIEWFQSLDLTPGKKIMPLAHNWACQRGFLSEWLGERNFQYCFDHRYRDTQAAGLYLDDRADVDVEQCPFPKVDLQYMSTTLKNNFDPNYTHDTIYECAKVAEVYKQSLRIQTGVLG